MPQAPTVAQPPRLPLVIQPENRSESSNKDAKLLNGYVEKNEATGETWVYKRPGLLQTGATQTGNGYGVYNWLGDTYAIFGATMYKNGVALIGTLDTTGGVYRFSQCLGTTPRMQFGNGVATYNYDAGAGIVKIDPLLTITAGSFVVGIEYTILTVGTTDFTLIGASANTVGVIFTATGVGAGTGTATTPSNFPTTCVKGIGYLDGTVYVMDADASIRGCTSLNDPTSWTDLLNRLTAQIEADPGVALAKQLVYIIAIGQWSTEVFYDAQNATASPLGPVQGAKINFGCVNQDSVQEIDGVLFWIASNRSSAAQVIMVENLKPTIVSTKPIERLLGEVDFSAVHSWGLKYEGHRFYGITLKNENLTLVYDMTDKMWAQWTDANGNYFPIVSSTFLNDHTRLLQHETNGKLYLFDSDYTNDDGDMITVDLYTPNFDGQTRRRKTLNMMEFVGDQTEGSILQVRHNDNDYDSKKWSNPRKVNMALKKPVLTDEGTFLRRAYHIRHQCNTRLRIQAIELQLDIGTI
jgi:hypothetical protein